MCHVRLDPIVVAKLAHRRLVFVKLATIAQRVVVHHLVPVYVQPGSFVLLVHHRHHHVIPVNTVQLDHLLARRVWRVTSVQAQLQ